jgi:hypothetical protein
MMVESGKPMLKVRDPKWLTIGAVLALNGFGLLAFAPVLLSFAVVSVIPFGKVTFLLPVAMLCLVTFFLPLAFGNPYVQYLAGKLERTGAQQDFLVQVTCRPRRSGGPRGVLEDADDIGWLGVVEGHLEFKGDSLSLKLPRASIRGVSRQSVGWRGLFLTHRTVVQVEGVAGINAFEFTERSSWLLLQSRRIGVEMHKVLESFC